MESRILLAKRGCSMCNDAVKVINMLNLKLALDKQIRIIDCHDWEEFGVITVPLIEVFTRMGFNSYPFLYIDGMIIEPSPTREQLKIFLESFLKEDFII